MTKNRNGRPKQFGPHFWFGLVVLSGCVFLALHFLPMLAHKPQPEPPQLVCTTSCVFPDPATSNGAPAILHHVRVHPYRAYRVARTVLPRG